MANAAEQIENGTVVYFTEVDGFAARLQVVTGAGGRYVRTAADTTAANNLDLLPDC